MNSKELYVAICTILSLETNNTTKPKRADYMRYAQSSVSYNHKHNVASMATLEYAGTRANFQCIILFDGAGGNDTSIHNFFMPRQKLNIHQKALMALSVLDYLIGEDQIDDADFDFIREKFQFDANGGVGNLLEDYDKLKAAAVAFVQREDSAPENQL